MKTKPILAWHFVTSDTRLRSPVGAETHARPGVTLRHGGRLIPCLEGLHASVGALDVLGLAPGPIVCRVRMSGQIVHASNKLVATERRVLWMADASQTLRLFACDCAERALLVARKVGWEPDRRGWAAVQTARDFLNGLTTINVFWDTFTTALAASREAYSAARAGPNAQIYALADTLSAAVSAAAAVATADNAGIPAVAHTTASTAASAIGCTRARATTGAYVYADTYGKEQERQNKRLTKALMALKPKKGTQ